MSNERARRRRESRHHASQGHSGRRSPPDTEGPLPHCNGRLIEYRDPLDRTNATERSTDRRRLRGDIQRRSGSVPIARQRRHSHFDGVEIGREVRHRGQGCPRHGRTHGNAMLLHDRGIQSRGGGALTLSRALHIGHSALPRTSGRHTRASALIPCYEWHPDLVAERSHCCDLGIWVPLG
jgi:hypothetical protein